MKHSDVKRPDWAYSQRQADITDVWVEQGNQEGPAVTAHLIENTSGFMELQGLEVEELQVTLFYDRTEAFQWLGSKAVYEIEETEDDLIADEARFA